jgi:RNA polymerase sigma-70 factor (ECF subfamily)
MTSEEDWIRIYHDTLVHLYEYVSRRTGGDRSLSEDATQETWLRALQTWPGKGIPREPLAWLKAVARNLLRNHYRRRRPVSLDPEIPERAPATPEAARTLQWGMSLLRKGHAELIEAYHLDGMSIAEVASRFRLSERAVEGRLRRAREKLATILRGAQT